MTMENPPFEDFKARCISYWNMRISNVMVVFRGVIGRSPAKALLDSTKWAPKWSYNLYTYGFFTPVKPIYKARLLEAPMSCRTPSSLDDSTDAVKTRMQKRKASVRTQGAPFGVQGLFCDMVILDKSLKSMFMFQRLTAVISGSMAARTGGPVTIGRRFNPGPGANFAGLSTPRAKRAFFHCGTWRRSTTWKPLWRPETEKVHFLLRICFLNHLEASQEKATRELAEKALEAHTPTRSRSRCSGCFRSSRHGTPCRIVLALT